MYRIGIDLGGTNIAAGIVNESFEIIAKGSTPTLAHERASEEIVADMAKLCKKLIADAGLTEADITSIGVVSPGVVDDQKGTVVRAYNLGFTHFPLVDLLKKQINVPNVYIENDANAAAWGEAVAGAAKGTNYSVMITLGTGVGGGIIIDGKVYSGFNAAGGELGHIVIEKDGVQCTCGRRGCWETYSSATALVRMTKEKIAECRENGRDSIMLSAERISGRTACEAMRQGDEAAREVYDKYVSYLATGLTNIVNIFQPEVISLGGGVSNEGQSLIDSLLPLVRKEQYGSGFVPSTEIRIAELKNDAGIIGAAAL